MKVEHGAVHLSLCKQHTGTQLLSQYITSNKHSTVSRARASQPALKLIKRRWQTSMFGKDGITSVDTGVGVDDCFFCCFFFVCGSEQKHTPRREAFRHAEWTEKRRTRSALRGRTFSLNVA